MSIETHEGGGYADGSSKAATEREQEGVVTQAGQAGNRLEGIEDDGSLQEFDLTGPSGSDDGVCDASGEKLRGGAVRKVAKLEKKVLVAKQTRKGGSSRVSGPSCIEDAKAIGFLGGSASLGSRLSEGCTPKAKPTRKRLHYYSPDGRQLKGVSVGWTQGTYRAQCSLDVDGAKEYVYLGCFYPTPEAAARACDRYLLKTCGPEECEGRLNFPLSDYQEQAPCTLTDMSPRPGGVGTGGRGGGEESQQEHAEELDKESGQGDVVVSTLASKVIITGPGNIAVAQGRELCFVDLSQNSDPEDPPVVGKSERKRTRHYSTDGRLLKGVTKGKKYKSYAAQCHFIREGKRQVAYLGSYPTPDEAGRAYDRFVLNLYGPSGCLGKLNYPLSDYQAQDLEHSNGHELAGFGGDCLQGSKVERGEEQAQDRWNLEGAGCQEREIQQYSDVGSGGHKPGHQADGTAGGGSGLSAATAGAGESTLTARQKQAPYYSADNRLLKGVTYRDGKYTAQHAVSHQGRQTTIFLGGHFLTPDCAARAYDQYLLKTYGLEGCKGKLNFPISDYDEEVLTLRQSEKEGKAQLHETAECIEVNEHGEGHPEKGKEETGPVSPCEPHDNMDGPEDNPPLHGLHFFPTRATSLGPCPNAALDPARGPGTSPPVATLPVHMANMQLPAIEAPCALQEIRTTQPQALTSKTSTSAVLSSGKMADRVDAVWDDSRSGVSNPVQQVVPINEGGIGADHGLITRPGTDVQSGTGAGGMPSLRDGSQAPLKRRRTYFDVKGKRLTNVGLQRIGKYWGRCQLNRNGDKVVVSAGSSFPSAEAAARALDLCLLRRFGVEESRRHLNYPVDEYLDQLRGLAPQGPPPGNDAGQGGPGCGKAAVPVSCEGREDVEAGTTSTDKPTGTLGAPSSSTVQLVKRVPVGLAALCHPENPEATARRKVSTSDGHRRTDTRMTKRDLQVVGQAAASSVCENSNRRGPAKGPSLAPSGCVGVKAEPDMSEGGFAGVGGALLVPSLLYPLNELPHDQVGHQLAGTASKGIAHAEDLAPLSEYQPPLGLEGEARVLEAMEESCIEAQDGLAVLDSPQQLVVGAPGSMGLPLHLNMAKDSDQIGVIVGETGSREMELHPGQVDANAVNPDNENRHTGFALDVQTEGGLADCSQPLVGAPEDELPASLGISEGHRGDLCGTDYGADLEEVSDSGYVGDSQEVMEGEELVGDDENEDGVKDTDEIRSGEQRVQPGGVHKSSSNHGYKGITRCSNNTWLAQTFLPNRKRLFCFTGFGSPEEAAQMYDRALIKFRGLEVAKGLTNFNWRLYIDESTGQLKEEPQSQRCTRRLPRPYLRGKRWEGHACVHGQKVHLGTFDSEEEACMAHDFALVQLLGLDRCKDRLHGGWEGYTLHQMQQAFPEVSDTVTKRLQVLNLSKSAICGDLGFEKPGPAEDAVSGVRGVSGQKYKGLTLRNDKWEVRLSVNGRLRTFGRYDNQEEAAKVYDEALIMHKGLAYSRGRTNMPWNEYEEKLRQSGEAGDLTSGSGTRRKRVLDVGDGGGGGGSWKRPRRSISGEACSSDNEAGQDGCVSGGAEGYDLSPTTPVPGPSGRNQDEQDDAGKGETREPCKMWGKGDLQPGLRLEPETPSPPGQQELVDGATTNDQRSPSLSVPGGPSTRLYALPVSSKMTACRPAAQYVSRLTARLQGYSTRDVASVEHGPAPGSGRVLGLTFDEELTAMYFEEQWSWREGLALTLDWRDQVCLSGMHRALVREMRLRVSDLYREVAEYLGLVEDPQKELDEDKGLRFMETLSFGSGDIAARGSKLRGARAAIDLPAGRVLGALRGHVSRQQDQEEPPTSTRLPAPPNFPGTHEDWKLWVEAHTLRMPCCFPGELCPTFMQVLCLDAEGPTLLLNDPVTGPLASDDPGRAMQDLASDPLPPPNVSFVVFLIRGWPFPFLVTSREIVQGGELLLSYGEDYWERVGRLVRDVQAGEQGRI